MIETCLPTPEAVVKLNLDVIIGANGACISAKTRNKTILDELIEKGYIEPYHAEYGLTFTILREVWLGKLAARTAMLSDAIIAQCPQNNPSEVYDYVYRHLKPNRARIVFWATQSATQPINALIGQICHDVFERLADAFTDTHKLLAESNMPC